MKDVELKLIAELMKNSRRSDRDLAKAVGVSQPTISRTLKKLEKEGYINEYTMLPNLGKLGFEIMSFSFTKLKRGITDEEVERKKNEMLAVLKKEPLPIFLHLGGLGLGAERVMVALHTDYSAYATFVTRLKANPLLEADQVNSFMVNLTDEKGSFLKPTMSMVAHFLTKVKK